MRKQQCSPWRAVVLEEEVKLDAVGPGTGAEFISAVAGQAHLFSH